MRDYTIFIPEFIALGVAVFVVAVELLWPKVRKDYLAYMTAAGAGAWGIAGLFFIGKDPNSFQGLIISDDFTTYFRILGAGIVLVVSLMSAQYLRERTRTAAEYYGLLLVAGSAMVYMAAARELVTAYISLEVLSFCLYILVGFVKRDPLANEASLKYILLGAFSSAMLLYGISYIYGITNSTYYSEISVALADPGNDTAGAVVVGFVLILAGVGFKVSAVPFHMWAPDAYQGAPLPVTAFLSTASKAAGFALFLRLFSEAFTTDAAEWRWAVAILAATTMTVGNLIAIQQTSVKRLVAYSSIGQVGYMLIPIAALGYGDADVRLGASAGLLVHIAGYVISTLALFAAVTAYFNRTGDDSIRGMRGMAETQPFLAMVITVSLLSFAGLPFFAGFATKFLMFQGSTSDELLWLIGLAVANSFVSLYYYLMIVKQMYLFEPEGGLQRFAVPKVLWGLSAVLLLGVLAIGVYPGPWFEAADQAAQQLLGSGAAGIVQAP
ncbi:MAG: NADH-quinone oxidoreductase subunit N [Dehalococcoidia bacterium]